MTREVQGHYLIDFPNLGPILGLTKSRLNCHATLHWSIEVRRCVVGLFEFKTGLVGGPFYIFNCPRIESRREVNRTLGPYRQINLVTCYIYELYRATEQPIEPLLLTPLRDVIVAVPVDQLDKPNLPSS